MQAAAAFRTAPFLPLAPSKNLSNPVTFPSKLGGSSLASRGSPFQTYSVPHDTNTVDYSSSSSVFPADACFADMYPEVRLPTQQPIININIKQATEGIDREYLEYNGHKTVFPAEACDDLG